MVVMGRVALGAMPGAPLGHFLGRLRAWPLGAQEQPTSLQNCMVLATIPAGQLILLELNTLQVYN